MSIKSIQLSETSWEQLREKLRENYPLSALIIQEKTKRVLGFTIRRHQEWEQNMEHEFMVTRQSVINTVFLDFYDEQKKFMFMPKYSEYLGKSGKTNY
jgi:hypothetical protein